MIIVIDDVSNVLFISKSKCFENYNSLFLQDEVTFKYLRGLKSLVIDEFYLHRYMDYMIQSLRLCGVHVSVLYRSGVKKGPNRGE